MMHGRQLRISSACHPQDVIWKNLAIFKNERRNRICISISILALVLLFSFFLILGIGIINSYSSKYKNIALYLNALSVVLTLLINFVLWKFIYRLIKYESHKTKTNQKYSSTIKLFVTQFINQSLMYLAISEINSSNKYSWTSASGLIPQISALFTISGIVGIAMNLIHF